MRCAVNVAPQRGVRDRDAREIARCTSDGHRVERLRRLRDERPNDRVTEVGVAQEAHVLERRSANGLLADLELDALGRVHGVRNCAWA